MVCIAEVVLGIAGSLRNGAINIINVRYPSSTGSQMEDGSESIPPNGCSAEND